MVTLFRDLRHLLNLLAIQADHQSLPLLRQRTSQSLRLLLLLLVLPAALLSVALYSLEMDLWLVPLVDLPLVSPSRLLVRPVDQVSLQHPRLVCPLPLCQ